jgi:hypothetical protein
MKCLESHGTSHPKQKILKCDLWRGAFEVLICFFLKPYAKKDIVCNF